MSVEELLGLARAQNIKIATAESCTSGLVAGAITQVAGSSDVFDRGFVTYSDGAKAEMLGVDPGLIAAHGAVSEDVAAAMAEGALGRSDADIAISVTGIAGPGGSDMKPEGRVCFGLAVKGQPTLAETVEFGAKGRDGVRARSVAHAIALLAEALSQDA